MKLSDKQGLSKLAADMGTEALTAAEIQSIASKMSTSITALWDTPTFKTSELHKRHDHTVRAVLVNRVWQQIDVENGGCEGRRLLTYLIGASPPKGWLHHSQKEGLDMRQWFASRAAPSACRFLTTLGIPAPKGLREDTLVIPDYDANGKRRNKGWKMVACTST